MNELFKEKFILGTANFGMPYGSQKYNGKLYRKKIHQIIDFMVINNLTEIDTAEAYGNAETVLGEIGIQEFKVTTKFYLTKNENIFNRTYNSLERLRIDSLDTVLIHNAESLSESDLIYFYDQASELKKQGLINKFGISIYKKDFLLELNKPHFDVVQTAVNIFDRSFTEKDVNNHSITTGTQLHARSIFMQGILLMDSKIFLKHFSGRSRKIFEAYVNFVSDLKMTQLEYCLGCALYEPLIKKIVIGVDSAKQLTEISSVEFMCKPPHIDLFALNKLEEFEEFINPLNW
jgi:aryl-alcohol dehydrogenase-like predicted oxidoreductase